MNWKNNFSKENRYFETSNGILYCADVFDLLTKFPKESIDCVITSPPYYSQRFYGEVANKVWGGDPNCNHEWSSEILVRERGKAGTSNTGNHSKRIPGQEEYKCYGQFCLKCKAWHGQLGLEPDFNMYLKHLWQLFDEIYKILKPTGTCWVNLGDTYAGSGKGAGYKGKSKHTWSFDKKPKIKEKLPPKCLCMIPERFAIGMIDRSWILRNEIVWEKPNCLPESVSDRFTRSHEKIFFFVKQKKYYFKQQLEPYVSKPTGKRDRSLEPSNSDYPYGDRFSKGARDWYSLGGRNKRTVWRITTKPTKFKHFASFCIDIPEICIKAGCPDDGIVLDPFAGIATTALASEKLNRKWICIEINPDYCEIAKQRIVEFLKQPKRKTLL